MSTTETLGNIAISGLGAGKVDLKLEVVSIPVSDVERAKEFYLRLGWRLDADFRDGDKRAIQLTPPGSPCSIQFAPDATPAAPGQALEVPPKLLV